MKWFVQCLKISEAVISQTSHFSHFNCQWAQYHFPKGKSSFKSVAGLLHSYLLGGLGYFLHLTPIFCNCARLDIFTKQIPCFFLCNGWLKNLSTFLRSKTLCLDQKNNRSCLFLFPSDFSCVCDMCQLLLCLACPKTPPLLKERKENSGLTT